MKKIGTVKVKMNMRSTQSVGAADAARISAGTFAREPAWSYHSSRLQRTNQATPATGLVKPRARRDSFFTNRRCAPISLTDNDSSIFQLIQISVNC